jgi:transposase
LVDTEGVILQALVHAADVRDGTGGQWVLEALDPVQTRFPRLQHLWVDAAYRGQFVDWVKDTLGWSVEVVKHWWTGVSSVWVAPGQEPPEKPTGFHVLPRRGVVARTFGWLGWWRRLSKDYEYLPATSEAMVYMAMSRVMLARLARLPA